LTRSIASTSEAIATWRSHIGNLSKEERDRFLRYSAADVKQYIAAIEKTVKDQSKKSRAIRIAQLINPLFQTMNMYAPIAQTMIQADPSSSSLVLGGITCIMSISSRFLDYQEKMAKTLSEMLEKLEILLQYGASVYRNNAPVQTALMEVYGDILQFCIEASRLFLDDSGQPRSSIKTLLASLRQPFESKFSEILYKFDRHLKAFEEKAKLVDRERIESGRAMQFQFMRNQIVESYQNHRDVVSIGYQMLEVASQRQLEESENRIREFRRMRGWKSISFSFSCLTR
jgi:ankyrin repeat domain-containing protein 50